MGGMDMKQVPSSAELESLYYNAVAIAGENPNALGFMRRVPGQRLYRQPPRGMIDPGPSETDLSRAAAEFRLALRVGHW